MRKFSEVLEDYLDERDRQNSDYYDNRYIGSKMQGRQRMDGLAAEMDEMVHAAWEIKYERTNF